jgi:hypothetical protein
MSASSSKKRKAFSFADNDDSGSQGSAKRPKFDQHAIDFEDEGDAESKSERKAVDSSAGMHPRNIYKHAPPVRCSSLSNPTEWFLSLTQDFHALAKRYPAFAKQYVPLRYARRHTVSPFSPSLLMQRQDHQQRRRCTRLERP